MYNIASICDRGYAYSTAAALDDTFDCIEAGLLFADPARLVADTVAFLRQNADTAARAWLPKVRVIFADTR
jgi:hypothetical protein